MGLDALQGGEMKKGWVREGDEGLNAAKHFTRCKTSVFANMVGNCFFFFFCTGILYS